jgi:hypothetical protein
MKETTNYKTGLLSPPSENALGKEIHGRGWKLHFEFIDSALVGNEVVIAAQKRETAQSAADQIVAVLRVLSGDTDPLEFEPFVNSESDKFVFGSDEFLLSKEAICRYGLVYACELAAKASRRIGCQYALEKYRHSVDIYCLSPNDVFSRYHTHVCTTQSKMMHIKFANAIVNAYAAIEDLHLEIRANSNNPSKIGGMWNPVVLDDLTKRLEKANISPESTITWLARGPKRKLEQIKPVETATQEPWAKANLRDNDVKIIDALAYASWLRSKISSHGTGKLASSLSPYDVTNCQMLIRRLILGILGVDFND